MKACKDLCPVHQIQRCCFLCDEWGACKEVCNEESNNLCELLIDIPDGNCEQLAEPLLAKLEQVLKQKKELEEKEKDLKASLQKLMEEYSETGLKNNSHIKVTYIKASTRVGFDTDLFKKSDPATYAKYCVKETTNKAYIKCELMKGG